MLVGLCFGDELLSFVSGLCVLCFSFEFSIQYFILVEDTYLDGERWNESLDPRALLALLTWQWVLQMSWGQLCLCSACQGGDVRDGPQSDVVGWGVVKWVARPWVAAGTLTCRWMLQMSNCKLLLKTVIYMIAVCTVTW